MSSRQKTSKDSGGPPSSTPHAPRQRKPFPFGPAYPERQRRYIDVNRIKSWSTSDLIKSPQIQSRPSEPIVTKERVHQSARTVFVTPFRRTVNCVLPAGVPRLDLTRFNEPDDQMDPVEIIQVPSIKKEDYTTTRTDISWGTPRLPSKPSQPKEEKEEVEREKEEEKEEEREEVSTSQASSELKNDKRPTASITPIAMPDHQLRYVENKLLSHERGKMEPFYRSKTSDKLDTVLQPTSDVGLTKRIQFGARILTQNGRDVHRELCGFFILNDGTMTIYEFRQFGQRLSALPLLSRAVYKFPRGKREGESYKIMHIKKGSTLYFDTSSIPSLPEGLKKRPLLAIRITQVDEQTKWNLLKEGFQPAEYSKLRDYLSQSPSVETQCTKRLLTTLQGMLRNRLQGRASQTLVGLGRLLREMCNENGLISQLHLQQALRAFHISLTPEDFHQLWDSLREVYIVTSNVVSSREGSGRVHEGAWLERCITGLVGELKEERQLIIRKVFQKLDAGRKGTIHISDLHKHFCPSNHPDVLNGRKTIEEVIHTVVGYLLPPQAQYKSNDRNCISYADFEHYYIGVSIDIIADHEFVHLLRRCWSL